VGAMHTGADMEGLMAGLAAAEEGEVLVAAE